MNKMKEMYAKAQVTAEVLEHIFFQAQGKTDQVENYAKQYDENQEQWYIEQIEKLQAEIRALEEIAKQISK